MVKIIKIIGQTIGYITEWIWLLLLFLLFAIRTSPVQTYLTKGITAFLSNELNTEISVDAVGIVYLDEIVFEGILVKDKENDTLAYIETIYLSIDKFIPNSILSINEINIQDGDFHLKRRNKQFNFQFLSDYFSQPSSNKKSKTKIKIDHIALSNSRFSYHDNNAPRRGFGVDYKHLDIKNINLEANRLSLENNNYDLFIKHLSFNEKSGIEVKHLTSQIKFSSNGVFARRLNIQTKESNVYSPVFQLKTKEMSDFLDFNNKVVFNSKIFESRISLYEVSLFAPKLEGMDEIVQVKGNIDHHVNNMKIDDINLRFGTKSIIKGTFFLPNFYEFNTSYFNERIDYLSVNIKDLKKIHLPFSFKDHYIPIPNSLASLEYIEASKVKLNGFTSQFVFSAKKINSKLGSIEMNNGLLFTKNTSDASYYFEKSQASEYDIKINSFDLGTLVKNKSLGKIDGIFFFSGQTDGIKTLSFSEIEGKLNYCDFDGYNYKNISLSEGSFIDQVFNSKIEIQDDNLALKYEGKIDFKNDKHLDITIDLSKAILDNLNISPKSNTKLAAKFKLDLKGNNLNNIKGTIKLEGLDYSENGKQYKLPDLLIQIDRSPTIDRLNIWSDLANLSIQGKVDFNTILTDLQQQSSTLFPRLIDPSAHTKKTSTNSFEYDVELKEINKLLAVVYPDLKIANGTRIKGSQDSKEKTTLIDINSKKIKWKDIEAKNIIVKNAIGANKLNSSYQIDEIQLNDSLNLKNINFELKGDSSSIHAALDWNPNTTNYSSINWSTKVKGIAAYDFIFDKSFIAFDNKKWEINQNAKINIQGYEIKVDNLKLQNEDQFIQLEGLISKSNNDQLNFKINELNLRDFNSFLGRNKYEGTVNGWGYISNPYDNISFMGDAYLRNFHFNDREVGDVFVQSQWQRGSDNIILKGDLSYKSSKTFKFIGNYLYKQPKNNLDFNLLFENTDIKFTNAFFDPEIVSNIKGSLSGKIYLSGELDNPKIEGKIKLNDGNAKLALLNVDFGLNGEILCDEYGFYINNMPITDEEGNTGSVIGSAYHEQLSKWNYDVVFNLEDDMKKYKNAPIIIKPLSKFLVMNTAYNEEDVYYGKGYATGIVNIFGDEKLTDINVDLKTKTGTKINFPFYTVSEFNEDQQFIKFKSKSDNLSTTATKLDFTGVNLKLNFNITPEADIKIILDETTGDEISATGSGDITVALDKYNHLTLDGTYKVKKGDYNFVMRPINEKFNIEENGTVTWTGDPYNALIDLKCYYSVNASLNEISRNITTNNMGYQEINCYLNLTQSLLNPAIAFDIVAPNTNEAGQTLLNLIKNDKDMLNRQFFSLLLFKKFQSIDPQNTSVNSSGSAALDLAQSQINSMLSQVSKDYKLNVALDKNALTGGNSMAVGLKKGFYDDRLVFKGSVGIGTAGTASGQTQTLNQNQNPLIGDMNLEYSLNESGTFKINIFNESNQNTILNNQLGLFTQGAGLQYQEDFTTLDEFKALQYFLDVFRKKENKKFPTKRKRKQSPIPSQNNQIIIPKLDEE